MTEPVPGTYRDFHGRKGARLRVKRRTAEWDIEIGVGRKPNGDNQAVVAFTNLTDVRSLIEELEGVLQDAQQEQRRRAWRPPTEPSDRMGRPHRGGTDHSAGLRSAL